VVAAAEFQYGRSPSPSKALAALTSDARSACPLDETIRYLVAAGSRVHRFKFSSRGPASKSSWPAWAGAPRGSELAYVFGAPLDTQSAAFDADDRRLSSLMRRAWADFVRTG